MPQYPQLAVGVTDIVIGAGIERQPVVEGIRGHVACGGQCWHQGFIAQPVGTGALVAIGQGRIEIPEYRAQRQAAAQAVLVADVFPQPAVIQVAVIAVAETAGAQHQALTQQRLVDREPGAAIVIIAGLQCVAALEPVHRLVVVDQYGARGGVAAEQGALGPPQYLHPVYIHHGQRCAVDAADVAVVEDDGNAGLTTDAKAVGADTPDGVNGRADALLPPTQARGQRGEILDAVHALVLQLVAVENGYADRDISQGFFPVLGFYQHLFERLAGGGGKKRQYNAEPVIQCRAVPVDRTRIMPQLQGLLPIIWRAKALADFRGLRQRVMSGWVTMGSGAGALIARPGLTVSIAVRTNSGTAAQAHRSWGWRRRSHPRPPIPPGQCPRRYSPRPSGCCRRSHPPTFRSWTARSRGR